MKHSGYITMIFLASFLLNFSCSDTKSPNRNNDSATTNQNIDLANRFDEYFNDKNQVIPSTIYFEVTSEKIDTTFYPTILSCDRIRNLDCIYYIVKLNCIAGGDCAEYKLISFCDFKLSSIKTLGRDRADAENSLQFSYNIIDSTIIELISKEEKYNNDFEIVSDTIIKTTLILKK